MTIKEIKDAVRFLLKEPQVITPFIHGKPGVGKSAIIAQIAEELGISFIDLRLSQLESADIRGIPTPDHTMGSSRWLPPETIPFESFKDLPVPGDVIERKFGDGGILFLDEFNRARYDVLQAAFQLVLDRKVGLHKLLDNWYLVCSGNLGEADNTEVTEMTDSALNNRFAHLYVTDNGIFDCWLEWAENEGDIHQDVIGFLKQKPSYIYIEPQENEDVFCTPRSWEKFSRVLQAHQDEKPEKITELIGHAIIGTSTISFLEYLKEKRKITPKDIINRFGEVKDYVENLDRSRKYSLANELTTFINEAKEINIKQLDNFHKFVTEIIEPDHMISMFKVLVDSTIDFKTKKSTKKDQEFIDIYLDSYPDMDNNLAEILYGASDND